MRLRHQSMVNAPQRSVAVGDWSDLGCRASRGESSHLYIDNLAVSGRY